MDWLIDRMKQWKDEPAIIWRDKEFTYQQILDRTALWQKELDSHGINPGKVVAIEGDYSLNGCSLLLALIGQGTIILPLTKAARAHREEFLETAEVLIIFTIDDHDNWQIEKRNVNVNNQLTQSLIEMRDPGLILFSSGSTGKSKAALHNFQKLLEKFKVRRHRMRVINFLLFDHIGGINTLFYTLSNGGTAVMTQSRDVEAVCELIEKYGVELLPTTPTFLNLLLISEAYRNFDLSSLKLITYGTEVMPESTLQRINKIFPDTRLLQTYGLSELGILRSKSKNSDSLWVKIGGEGFETKIVDNILWIRAESAMLGYLNAPSPFDKEGWMNTEDVVEVDGDYFRILGRRTDIINVGGQKVYPSEVESILMQMDNIKDVVVYGEPNPIMGHFVAAQINLFQFENLNDLRKRIRSFCEDKLATYKIPVRVKIVEVEQFNERYKRLRRIGKY